MSSRTIVQGIAVPDEDAMETLWDEIMEESVERGLQRGLERGRREVLLRLRGRRFGDLPEQVRELIARAGVEQLDTWADNVLAAATLDGVFEEARPGRNAGAPPLQGR